MTAAEALKQLAEDYWEGLLQRDPLVATFYGDYRYNDRLPDVGPDGRRAEEDLLAATRARLEPLLSAELGDEDRITADMLKLSVDFGVEALRLRLDELVVDQMQGPQVWLPELLNWHPTDTPEHVEQLIARYRAFDAHIDQYLGNLEDGVRDGRTAPEIAVERVLAQLRALLTDAPDTSPLVTRANIEQPELAAALRRAVADTVYPAFQRMLDYLSDYLERHARRDPGVWSVTDGAEIYALLARQHTTTDLTPDELHQIGRDDLVGIHAEMRQIMAREGKVDTSIRDYTERMTRDPANLPKSREEIVERSERLLAAAKRRCHAPSGACPDTVPGQADRGIPRARRAAGLLLPAIGGQLAARHVLRQHLRAQFTTVAHAAGAGLPRRRARASPADRAGPGDPRPAALSAARRRLAGQRLRRGLGAVYGASGR